MTDAFQYLRTGDDERILLCLVVDLPVFESFLRSNLLDRIRLASGARLVTSNTMTSDQDAITRNDFTRFQKGEVADKDIL